MGRRQKSALDRRFRLWVIPSAWQEIKALPGYMRQRVRKAVDVLAIEPRPPQSRELSLEEYDGELRRIRIESWRVVYVVSETDRTVDVLAVRKRPPYRYEDLGELIAQLP